MGTSRYWLSTIGHCPRTGRPPEARCLEQREAKIYSFSQLSDELNKINLHIIPCICYIGTKTFLSIADKDNKFACLIILLNQGNALHLPGVKCTKKNFSIIISIQISYSSHTKIQAETFCHTFQFYIHNNVLHDNNTFLVISHVNILWFVNSGGGREPWWQANMNQC